MPAEAGETAPLIGRGLQPRYSKRLRQHLVAPVNLRHAYAPLIASCFVTGLIDAGAYNAWGTFMGMQTGNTIFLALGVAGLPADSKHLQWLRSIVAISSFMLGSCIASNIASRFGKTRRLSLILSFLLQGLLILITGILITADVIPQKKPNSDRIFIGIPFLAAQSGAQVAASRALGFSEIPTTVLTSVYNDLVSDSRLLAKNNPKRNRRVGAAVMMLLGGICGGWLSRLNDGFGIALWVGGVIKILLAAAWLWYADSME
ncbi:MAG: hypothetical protein Q9214_007602 [Letrouitia sp. 1 TL-2023]